MHWIQNNGLTYLQFPALSLEPDFFHGIFLSYTRNSPGRITGFNLGTGCGTPDDTVARNRRRMLNVFGNGLTGVYAHQVHGTQVGIWNTGQPGSTAVRLEGDALMSARTGGALVIQTADCQSIIVVDPAKRVVANIHSGWRGSIGNIIGRTVETMAATYGSRPGDLICGIGPSLGPCCAEFVNYRQEIPRPYWRYRRSGDYFDFWRVSADQLTKSGVRGANIHVAGICTKCNQHLFFSYRGDRQTGRFATVVGIQSRPEGKL